jgi:hypothetical protein
MFLLLNFIVKFWIELLYTLGANAMTKLHAHFFIEKFFKRNPNPLLISDVFARGTNWNKPF